jgi:hypothetical protein
MSAPAARKELIGWDAIKGWPSMSQIGGLRATLPGLPGSHDALNNPVKRWIKQQNEKPSKRESNSSSSPWSKVEELVSKPSEIWQALCLSTDERCPPVVPSGTRDAMRARLWSFAVTNTLLLAIRHHKRATEKPAEAAATVAGGIT